MKRQQILIYGALSLCFLSGMIMLYFGSVKKIQSDQIINKVRVLNQKSLVIPSGTSTTKANATYQFDDVKELNTNLEKEGLKKQTVIKQIGEISIPAINLRTHINEGLNNIELATGAGTLKPNQKIGEGNYALGGHDAYGRKIDDWLFANLHLARVGNIVRLSNKQETTTYRITNIEVVNIHAVDVIQNSECSGTPIITLLTCYSPNGHTSKSQRLMVRGILTSIHRK